MNDIPLGVKVNGTDGPAGTSTAVIVDPLKETVTHVVVKIYEHNERLVPLEHVVETDHDSISLNCTSKDLDLMPKFKEYQYVEGVLSNPEVQGTSYNRPYVTLDYSGEMREVEVVPEGEFAIHRGDPIYATNGQVGKVGELVVDLESGHITHLLLEKGHLWGKREVTVALDLIDRVENSVVYLKIDKDAVKDLPSMKVKRHY